MTTTADRLLADTASVDAIIDALYDVISGPAGERDYGRRRNLFLPGARLIPADPLTQGAGYTVLPYASVHLLFEAGRVEVWPFDPQITRKLMLATSSQKPMSSTFRPLFRTVRAELRDIISTHVWKPPRLRWQ